jgi:cytochrome c peroxidase
MKFKSDMYLVVVALFCMLLTSLTAWGAQVVPPPTLLPLNQIPVPEPPSLFQYVKNKPAAIKLGKAFFWDMQVGSNGFQACASCHFKAGADNRLKNTINPGTRGGDSTFQIKGPNQLLELDDFPFFKLTNPDFPGVPVRNVNDVVGSQGVHLTQFNSIVPGSAVDDGTPIPDPVFQVSGVNMRRVTARNTPTNINAVFNFNNFWDGRAHFVFNGVNPFGPLDPTAGVWFNTTGTLVKTSVVIEFASLASQATGPPLDDTEMSYRGRTFPQLGRKMLSLTPLGKQLVHPNDSVLGPLSRGALQQNGTITGQNGLSISYNQMIKDAFQDYLWNSFQSTPDGFSQMEANFSLFWGLAIQLYEATLVSDQTPYDRFLGGDRTALTSQQQDGFNIFFGAAGCSACHISTELTAASVRNAAFLTNASHALIEPMVVASGQQIIYDNGFNNTAVRPTTEDIGRGGNSPFTNSLTSLPFPLSFSFLAELQSNGNLGFNPNLFPPGSPLTPILPAQIPANFPIANDGNFKVPGLRNVELTAPYFHNGGNMTLNDVVDFYARGGNFPVANRNSLDPGIVQIGAMQNNPTAQAALVAFMKSMTDERVRNESAPFDHPELFVPNGDPDIIRIPARDAFGSPAATIALTVDPVVSPTKWTAQTITGTNEPGAIVTISVNGGALLPAVASTVSTWKYDVSGLSAGINGISVTATDLANQKTTQTVSIIVDATVPTLTINALPPITPVTSLILSGTVEAGITPIILTSTNAVAGPVTVVNGVWNCTISGLESGINTFSVLAIDAAGNATLKTASVTYAIADGNLKGTGVADVSDALRALRISVGLIVATPQDLLHGDVAPLVNGIPTQNGVIDAGDALLILKKAVGLVSF